MPLCQVNIADDTPDLSGEAGRRLESALSGLPDDSPVIALIHGYKFSPHVAAHDPHTHILSLDPRPHWKAISWPRRLGLGDAGGAEPLCLAVGWEGRGTPWRAYARAARAGAGLATLIGAVRARRPGAPVQVLAHSLGARVTLSALPHLPAGAMGRAVLLAAAELRGRAAQAMGTPAGRALEVLNVTSAENAVFDLMLERLVAQGPRGWEPGLGRGRGPACPRWLDLRVDCPAARAGLAGLGFAVPAPDRRVCHWSVYLRAGLFDLYRAVLSGGLPVARLRAALPAPGAAAHRGLRAPAPLLSSRQGAS